MRRSLVEIITQAWKETADFFLPRHCLCCGDRLSTQENHICLSCLCSLPRTNYHHAEHSPMEQIFWGRFPIEKAVSFFFYDSDNVRRLIWALKYNAAPYMGEYLGRVYAREILESGFFDGIDLIVPVPLSWKRKLKRGYNQCEYIAKGISKETGIPIARNAVTRTTNNVTQTHLTQAERQDNVKNIFHVKDTQIIRGKHLLIIDDVLTTGATVSSLAETIAAADVQIRISVLTLSIAGQNKGMPYTDTGHLPDQVV